MAGFLSRPRIRIAALAAALAILAGLLVIGESRDTGPQDDNWVRALDRPVEEISLRRAWDLLTISAAQTDAAIEDGAIYLRPAPGNAPEAGETTAPETGETIAPETGETIAPAAGDTTPSARAPAIVETPDGPVLTRPVKAILPFPASRFIDHALVDSEVDLRIFGDPYPQATWTDRIIQLLPILIILGLVVFFLRRGATKSLGLSSAYEVIETDKLTEGFDDVAGIDTARGEIQEIVAFLKDPGAAARLGGRMPKGALFDGPPGTGKTLLARVMAKEAGVPFLSLQASGINQLFVGAGAMKISRAFREARKHAPCIVFIDEIDAMARARGAAGPGGAASDEKETTLNALLVELDGFDARDGVFVIAATNRPEILDPALTRRGRIDRRVTIGLPDRAGRRDILAAHARSIKLHPGLDFDPVAASTIGFSGADLAALANEAALAAARAGRDTVCQADFATARDRMLVGVRGARTALDGDDRKRAALHEAGHALVAALDPDADPIEKITILPQGGALGYVLQTPARDHLFETRDRLMARLRVTLAGRLAEELVHGSGGATSGAASDVAQATRIARAMVCDYGMSDLVFQRIEGAQADADLTGEIRRHVADIISQARHQVRTILKERQADLEALAHRLETCETLDGADLAVWRDTLRDTA